MAFLEVLTESVETLPEGWRFELPTDAPFSIGRMRDNHLSIPVGSVTRQHAQVFFRDGAFWVEDSRSTNGTFVNGRSAKSAIALSPGDFVDIAGVVILRFHDGPPPRPHQSRELEALIAADPRNDGAWQVWADWLLEHDDPLGDWMVATERTQAELARRMGALALRFNTRRLGVRWNRFGFLHTLRLPFATTGGAANPLWLVRHLQHVPAARFLVGLELELIPISFDPARYDRGDSPTRQLLAALREAALPSSLRVLHFDGRVVHSDLTRGMQEMMRPPPRTLLEATLEHVRLSCPRLETAPGELLTWEISEPVE